MASATLTDGSSIFLPTITLSAPDEIDGGMNRGMTVTRTVARKTEGNSTYLVYTSSATNPSDPGSATRVSEIVIKIGSAIWEGFRYAFLTNQVNCSFCHTRVDSVKRYYNMPTPDGKYDRVKVASI